MHILVAIKDGKTIIALPGFAYSSTVCAILYVLPLIYKFRKANESLPIVKARINQDFPRKMSKTIFTACNVEYVDNEYKINFDGKITGVEIDKYVITIANEYFHLDKIKNLEIIIDDAFEFVLKTKDNYDLIIIDIFQDTKMPNFLFETFFINRICDLLQPKGFILFNTMVLNEKQKQLNLVFLDAFDVTQYNVTKLHKIEELNELIIVESKL